MIQGNRVVACTPYGREVTASILFEYMRRDHENGIVDEWQLWMNTDPDQESDRAYADRLTTENDWVVQKHAPTHRNLNHVKQYNTRTFFEYCVEPDTVYLRFDDDIVYVHPDAVRHLVEQKLASSAFVTFPIIWNNAVSTWHLQMQGVVPLEWGKTEPYCMDPIGWADGPFAEKMHNLLLDHIEDDSVERLYLYNDVQLPANLQFSISCFACKSSEYVENCDPPGYIEGMYDEHWHSVEMPVKLNRPNIIVGTSIVSHFTFYPQRAYILGTNILDRYKAAAERLAL